MKSKSNLLILSPLLAGVVFVSLFAATSQLPPASQTNINLLETQQNSGAKEIYCQNDVAEDTDELSLLLENNVKAVNCLFGGCNSLF